MTSHGEAVADEPAVVMILQETEEERLCFLYKWGEMDLIPPGESHLSPGANKPFRWTKLK